MAPITVAADNTAITTSKKSGARMTRNLALPAVRCSTDHVTSPTESGTVLFMSLYETIGTAWKDAMKARDPKKDALAAIRTEVKNKVISTRTDGAGEINPADDLVLEVLRKMAKQRQESIAEYLAASRQDLVDKESQELQVIESFLPQKLSDDAVIALVKEAIAEVGATSAKDMGKAMKAALVKVAGRADGKVVQAQIKSLLP